MSVIGIGDFGSAVADLLCGRQSGNRLAPGLEEAFASDSHVVVLAMWRQQLSVCKTADQLSRQYSTPWLPVTMDHPRIRIGPVIVPGTRPCFSCFLTRRAQHDSQQSVTAALDRAYEDDTEAGPRGFLYHQARLSAALCQLMLEKLRCDPAGLAGQVVNFNVLRPGLRAHLVMACGDCRICYSVPAVPRSSYLDTFVDCVAPADTLENGPEF